MCRHYILIAASLISTSAFAADAPKAPIQHAAQPENRAAPVVLASAVEPQAAPAQDAPATAPKQPRIAGRVTTCRCGGQDADPEAQPEQ